MESRKSAADEYADAIIRLREERQAREWWALLKGTDRSELVAFGKRLTREQAILINT